MQSGGALCRGVTTDSSDWIENIFFARALASHPPAQVFAGTATFAGRRALRAAPHPASGRPVPVHSFTRNIG